MADDVLDQYVCPANAPVSDRAVEGAFLLRWEPDVRRAAQRASAQSRSEEEDLAQEARARVFMATRAWRNAPAPTAYIRTVLANALRSARRRDSRALSSRSPLACEFDEEQFAAAGNEPEDERARLVAKWVAGLPERLRTLYHYLYVEDCSQREAARLMGLSQPRVAQVHQQLLARGRAELAHLSE